MYDTSVCGHQLLRACRPRTTRPPASAALGSEIDDVVGGLDHVEVVLDDDHACCLASTSWFSTSSSRWMSAKWRPVVGSSRM